MTETEKKALALVNEVRVEYGYTVPITYDWFNADSFEHLAFLRAIEQHEAYRQEVSDAVEGFWNYCNATDTPFPADLDRFILPKPDPLKPDPLVEIWNHMIDTGNFGPDALRNAMKDRGYEWTKTSESNNES